MLRVLAASVHYAVRDRSGKSASLHAVEKVSFDVRRGQTVGIVGESGCGKSTLGRAIVRIERLSSGSIELDGTVISDLAEKDLTPLRRRMQMVFQDCQSSLNPRWSVGRSVVEPLRVHRLIESSARAVSVAELLDRVGLPVAVADRYPHQLSGGQQQRVAIARAIASSPDLVVCDEPVSALDVSVQAQITNLLADLQTEIGIAYIFIAHDLAVVRSISHVVVVMYMGRVVETGDSEAVFRRPCHPYTLALLSASPVPNAAAERERRRIILVGDPPDPVDPPAGCCFHTRCPWARERCSEETPELRLVDGDHTVACHFFEDHVGEIEELLPWTRSETAVE